MTSSLTADKGRSIRRNAVRISVIQCDQTVINARVVQPHPTERVAVAVKPPKYMLNFSDAETEVQVSGRTSATTRPRSAGIQRRTERITPPTKLNQHSPVCVARAIGFVLECTPRPLVRQFFWFGADGSKRSDLARASGVLRRAEPAPRRCQRMTLTTALTASERVSSPVQLLVTVADLYEPKDAVRAIVILTVTTL